MLLRTHLMIGITIILNFFTKVQDGVVFSAIVLIASILPDIDSGFSRIGRTTLFKPIQWFFGHRGLLHSYTFCIFVSLIFAFFYPLFALPFFLGYSFHLFADSFTKEGISPFWPLEKKSTGVITTGGVPENVIFSIFIVLNAILLVALFY